jgi:hypothetical protein
MFAASSKLLSPYFCKKSSNLSQFDAIVNIPSPFAVGGAETATGA